MNTKFTLLLLFLMSWTFLLAQEKSSAKFGNISADNFTKKIYDIDTSSSAVVLADIGSTNIIANSRGGFSLEFKRFRRVHILSKNGYDAGNVSIGLYTTNEQEEILENLKAVTYNLEGNKVVETKLDSKSGLFKDKLSKNLVVKKFTFPNVKEGSIIEYEYKIKSDFIFNLQPWEFQGSYPCLWSEYNVAIPEFYNYITLTQGFLPYHINTQKDKENNYTVKNNMESGLLDITAMVAHCRWVMKDVPAMKEEMFTSTIKNHIARIEFQLSELRAPFKPQSVMGNWKQATESLIKEETFGEELRKDNSWLNETMKVAAIGNTTLEKAKSVFYYLQKNTTCTNYNRVYCDNSLKTILKNGRGSEAEINLLLTAMLLKMNIEAEPVLLSTRSHGYVLALYPLMDRFNYVVTRAKIDGKFYFLDASQPMLGFGKLPLEAYNGHARVVNEMATPLDFDAGSLQESKVSSVIIINEKKGLLSGSFQQAPGYYESTRLRKKIKEKGKEEFFKEFTKGLNGEAKIYETSVEYLDDYEQGLGIKYEFDIKTEGEDIIYFNPMLGEGWKENPFKSVDRIYPVEIPYKIDETFLLKIDIPEGYVVDELPKEVILKLNRLNEGIFEYKISESAGSISLLSRLSINKAYFQPSAYDNLREFFSQVVKKHSEQIVFKKKK